MYKILIVEDVEAVADLQVLKLIRAGVAVETRRVETPQDFTRQLELYAPDAILCSVSVPRFSAVTALAMAQSLRDRKSTRLNSSHVSISYAVFCLKKKKPPWNNQSRAQH